MKTYLYLICLSCCSFCYTQNIRSLGAESSALANSTVSYPHLYAQLVNPALLSRNTGFSFGLNYSCKFLMKELQFQQLQLNHSYDKSSFGLSLSYLGSSIQQNIRFRVGYALKLNEDFALGLNLKYAYLNVNRSEFIQHRLNGDLGFVYKINEGFTLGASIVNLHRTTDDLYTLGLSAIRLGFNYQLSKTSGLLLQLNKLSSYGMSLNAGVYCALGSQVQIMFGVDFEHWNFSGGFKMRFKHFGCIFSFQHHNLLGISPDFNFEYKSQQNVE